jgi:hypothetical protein
MGTKYWLVFVSKCSGFQGAGERTFSTEVLFHILKRFLSSKALALKLIDPRPYTMVQYIIELSEFAAHTNNRGVRFS